VTSAQANPEHPPSSGGDPAGGAEPAAVIQLTHARDSALECDDRAASEVETRPRPR
jgi:hypothetical protein